MPNEKQPSYLAKLVHIRTRTDDEIEEYKLIYGKYLSEPYTEEKIRKLNSEEEIEKRKERRKQNKIENQRKLGVRRKLTAEDIEEMKKSSSRKIY